MKEGKSFQITQNEVLSAYKAVKANKGAGGVDRADFKQWEQVFFFIVGAEVPSGNRFAAFRVKVIETATADFQRDVVFLHKQILKFFQTVGRSSGILNRCAEKIFHDVCIRHRICFFES